MVILAGGDAVVKADLAGADVAAFAGLVNTFYHRLASVPGVRTPADLKGRAIGLPFLGGPQDMTVRAVLRRSKLAYGTDVRIRSMGAEYARLAAVTQGRVDAVTTDAPPSVLKALGLHVVADAPSWGLPFPYLAAAARRTFLRGKQDKAMRFLKALCGAMEFYRDHRDESLAMLAKHAANERGSTVDAEEAYLHNGPARYTYPPAVDPGTYAAVLDLISDERAAGRRPEDFIDPGVMEKLTRDGFFSRVGNRKSYSLDMPKRKIAGGRTLSLIPPQPAALGGGRRGARQSCPAEHFPAFWPKFARRPRPVSGGISSIFSAGRSRACARRRDRAGLGDGGLSFHGANSQSFRGGAQRGAEDRAHAFGRAVVRHRLAVQAVPGDFDGRLPHHRRRVRGG